MKYSGGTPFHFHGGDPAEHDKEIDPTKLKYTKKDKINTPYGIKKGNKILSQKL